MKKLGIIGAMQVEVEVLLSRMEKTQERQIAGTKFFEGVLEGVPVVVVQCGVGKVNAAICTQILCDCFQVTALVNTGVAGSLDSRLDIGDLVVSTDAMYHDVDCSCLGYPYGKVPQMDTVAFPADEALAQYAWTAAEQINPGHTWRGRIASGDQFIADKAVKARIIETTQGMCTEMEGTAIAHTAYRNGVPFVILRAISDKADDSEQVEYPVFEGMAARRCAEVTCLFVQQLGQ